MNNSDSSAHPKPHGVNFETATVNGWSGLTKREMMAMHAMQGIVARSGYTLDRSRAARSAVEFADELLKELEK